MHLDKVEGEEPIMDRDIIEQNQSFEHDEDDDRESERERGPTDASSALSTFGEPKPRTED
jgi:hypothetical protein